MNKKAFIIVSFLFILFLSIASVSAGLFDFLNGNDDTQVNVTEDGQYCTVDEVSSYIKKFHKLPSNYITKGEAKQLGWSGGPLKKYAPGKSIGGDVFTNRQGILPKITGKYIECDINANGTSRGAERIVFNPINFKVYTLLIIIIHL